MRERAQHLADRFQQSNEELISFALSLSQAQWRMPCFPEGRAVGVLLYHIAEGHFATLRGCVEGGGYDG